MAYAGTAGTFGYMRARIADEVLGGATTDQINAAIQDAIREYEPQRFWFNEGRWDTSPLTDANGQIIRDSGGNPLLGAPLLTTVAQQEFYPLVNSATSGAEVTLFNISHFDRLVILAFGNRYSLTWQTPQWMDDESVGPSWYALPQYWTLQALELRLYPIPDQAYSVFVIGTQRFPALVADGDSNPWTLQGELLIRRRAEQLLYQTVLRNPDMAAAIGTDQNPDTPLGKAYIALKGETMTRGGPPRIRPTSW